MPKLSFKTKLAVCFGSLAVSALIVAGALVYKDKYEPQLKTVTAGLKDYSLDELKQADGQGGRSCLVAVSGTVYKIEQGVQWQNGQHITSEGQAYCGADLTSVIEKAPHGQSKLEQLQKVGNLK